MEQSSPPPNAPSVPVWIFKASGSILPGNDRALDIALSHANR